MRTCFFDGPRADAPLLGYPPDAAERVRIHDDWAVWALGDVHGVLSGLREALRAAGLADADDHWAGGARVALVGLGDYIDRGANSRGVIEFLRTLGSEMASAGSRLVLVRGNHEQMVADLLRGCDEWLDAWAETGGHAMARSYGLASADRPIHRLREGLLTADPELLDWLLDTLPYAVWRDVVLVHAGLPSSGSLRSMLNSDGQLWDPDGFVVGIGVAHDPALAAFREAGVGRVVVGHVPQFAGPTIHHDGRLLVLDTSAPGSGIVGGAAHVALALLPAEGTLDVSRFVLANTEWAPDRVREGCQ